ncbi:MAG: helix-turn-helix transcriptional regulator [Desulfobacterales bacterium]|nr:helix-turn-helix transcriptional regulator [Desulfobacterales bacterium]
MLDKNNLLILLGKRIKSLRRFRGMTQEELGEKANINYKYLGTLERGEKQATIEILAKIADALDYDLHELLVFEHEDDVKILKKRIADMINIADSNQIRMIYRVVKTLIM